MMPNIVKKTLIILKPALLLVVILAAGAAAGEGELARTSLRVENLTCSACLTGIAAGLKELAGVQGMRADLEQGLIAVDHETAVPAEKIAAAITALGYPAKIVSTSTIAAVAFQDDAAGRGAGCCPNNSSGPCRAAAASWKDLFHRYFGKKNSATADKNIKN